jgi:protocatechuate 3,4-dioxygenase beta subunit
VLLMAGLRVAQHEVMYKPAQADPKYPQYFHTRWGTLAYFTSSGSETTVRGCWCKVVDTPAGEKTVTRNIELEPAKRKAVRVVDQDGNPVPACDAAGIVPRDMYPINQENGTVYVYGLEPDQERQIVVCQQERKLVGSLVVKESDKDPVVTLGPGGVVTGRAVDAEGNPLAGATVHLKHFAREAEWVFDALHFSRRVVTDANGEFRIDHVVPGHEFRLAFSKGTKNLGPNADRALRFRVGKPGETAAVGDVKVKPE